MSYELNINRREFVKAIGLGIGGLYLLPKTFLPDAYAAGKPKVVIIRNPKMINESDPDATVGTPLTLRKINDMEVKRAVYEALKILSGSGSPDELLNSVIKNTKSTVGLKVNAYFGEPNNATHPAVAYALAELISKIGINRNNIIIWDRAEDELNKANYQTNKSAKDVRCLATLTHRNPRFAKPFIGYEDSPITIGKAQVRLSKLVNMSNVIINMPVLRTYKFKDNTGISNAITNMYHAVNIAEADMPVFYDNECNPGAAEIYNIPAIKTRTGLTVCDAIYPLYNGGPGDDQRYHWRANAVIASLDPVALDTVAQDITQKYRDKVMPGEQPLKSVYLETCAKAPYLLGANDIKQIEVIEREI